MGDLLAKDIMQPNVITVTLDVSIKQAIQTLIQNKISGLIVVDEKEEVVGVLTEKDLLAAYDFLQKTNESVKNFVSQGLISVNLQTPIEEVSKLLVQRNIRRVPVLEDKKVKGIISRRDILSGILKNKK